MFSNSKKKRGLKYNILYYNPLPPPGLLPLKNQETVLSKRVRLRETILDLICIFSLSLLNTLFEATLYLLKKPKQCASSEEDEVKEDEEEVQEHEHEDDVLSGSNLLPESILISELLK
jgi:hypothetical protein